MHFDRLRMFKLIVETGSFSAAAKELRVSQPAVSQALKALERELGAKLIERSPRLVRPTTAGQAVYEAAGDILERWERLQVAISRMLDQPQGPLVIGASNLPAEYILPPLLGEYHRAFPQVDLTLHMAGSAAVVEWLLNREVEVGFIGSSVSNEELTCFAFERDELRLIGPPDADPGPLGVADLRRLPLVVREEGSGTRQVAFRCLGQHGLTLEQLRIVAVMGSNEAVVAAVAAGIGFAFVSRWAAEQAAASGRVRQLGFSCPHLVRYVYCAYRRGQPLNLAAAELVRLVREHAASRGLDPQPPVPV